MNLKSKKKSQLAIFIIISIIVIFLFIFLFSSNFEKKNQDILGSKNLILSDTNSKLFPLKNNVDFCLDKQLKKALIISGMRGGLIFDKGEYYSPSINLETRYKNSLINNLNLNWNNLNDKILIYFHNSIEVPIINESGNFYTHSIKGDFEKYILDEFLNCIDLKSYEKSGYTIDQEDFSSNIKKIINSKTIEIDKIIGKVGEKVRIILNQNEYVGKITQINLKTKITQINFEKNIFNNGNVDLKQISIRNLNSSVNVFVDFNDDNVVSSLVFPIVIKKGDFVTSYKNSLVSSQIRFKKYLEIANLLLNQKQNNRSLDYSKSYDLNRILNLSSYIKKTKLKNFQITRTIINNTPEYKRYVYSILDKDSKIYGSSYIFNFAYENNAPKIDLSKLNSNYYSDNDVMFIVGKNISFQKNIKDLVTDKQFFDNYRFYFKEDEEYASNYEYKLSRNGDLSFIAFSEDSFSFNIQTTDDEAIRTQRFTFVSGFPDNENNKAAKKCFSFENFEDLNGEFPINSTFKDEIFSYKDGLINRVYAYKLFVKDPITNFESSKLKFNINCFGIVDTSIIDLTYKINNGPSNLLPANNIITIPQDNLGSKYDVEVSISSNGVKLIKEPFKISIYSSRCLGPSEKSGNEKNLMGGSGSCCNLDPIKINSKPIENDVNSNLLNSGIVLNTDAYFTYNINSNQLGFPSSFDYENKIMWDILGNDVSSLFSGNLKATCGGVYPKYENNLDPITTSGTIDISSTISDFATGNKIYNLNSQNKIPISLTKVSGGSKCNFADLDVYENLVLKLTNGGIFNIGLVSKNSNPYSGPIPSGIPTFSNTFVKCSNDIFVTDINNPISSDWTKNLPFGSGYSSNNLVKSKGYCQVGNTNCAGRINSPIPYSFKIDEQCKDWSIDSSGSFISAPNTGWVCGSYIGQTCDTTSIPPSIVLDQNPTNLYCNIGVCSNPPNPPSCP